MSAKVKFRGWLAGSATPCAVGVTTTWYGSKGRDMRFDPRGLRSVWHRGLNNSGCSHRGDTLGGALSGSGTLGGGALSRLGTAGGGTLGGGTAGTKGVPNSILGCRAGRVFLGASTAASVCDYGDISYHYTPLRRILRCHGG